MRRVFGDMITSFGGMLLVLAALVVFDDRVREQAAMLVGTGHPGTRGTTELAAGAGARVWDLAVVVLQVARDQSLDHAGLMIFALAATVLVLFMLRT